MKEDCYPKGDVFGLDIYDDDVADAIGIGCWALDKKVFEGID